MKIAAVIFWFIFCFILGFWEPVLWMVMPIGLGFCCCDPPSCTLVSDNFSQDLLEINYTEIEDWIVANNEVKTYAANALLIHVNTLHSNFGHVSAIVKSDTNNSEAYLIGAYTDEDNYIFLKIKFGFGNKAELYERKDGTNTLLHASGPLWGGGALNSPIAIRLCWNEESASASWNYVGAFIVLQLLGGTTVVGNRAGVGTGINGGSIIFDDLVISEYQNSMPGLSCLPCLPCAVCDKKVPVRWEVEFLSWETGEAPVMDFGGQTLDLYMGVENLGGEPPAYMPGQQCVGGYGRPAGLSQIASHRVSVQLSSTHVIFHADQLISITPFWGFNADAAVEHDGDCMKEVTISGDIFIFGPWPNGTFEVKITPILD